MIDTNPRSTASPSSTRIEGNYLQAAMQYCVNINTIIWQRLAGMLLAQAGALAFCTQHPGTIAATVTVALAWGLSMFLIYAINSDQMVRTELWRQMNFITKHSMSAFYSENQKELQESGLSYPFELYDFNYDVRHSPVRDFGGRMILGLGLTIVDFLVVVFYGIQAFGPIKDVQLFGLPLIR